MGLRPVALYMGDLRYNPTRPKDVLVPEPREACILQCLLREFMPAGFPLKFFGKVDTDRTYKTFSTFSAVVLFPHDIALMTFYEFYAMGMPMFLPSHLSKYIFPYSASVPLLDWTPQWVANYTTASGRPEPREKGMSPLSLTSNAALEKWSGYMDFFQLPGVEYFASLPALMEILPRAKLSEMNSRMRRDHSARLEEATGFYASLLNKIVNV